MLYLSLGENCLSDNILKRYELKSFSTPYSHSRSNILYVLENERTKYKYLLLKKFISIKRRYEKDLCVNTNFAKTCHLFSKMVSKGFEFTHHDVLNDKKARDSYKRKIKRMLDLRRNKDAVCFLYHHRLIENLNIKKLVYYLNAFLKFYKNSFVCVFYQEIRKDKRCLEIIKKGNVILFKFVTKSMWVGSDPNLLWAHVDEDLILQMVNYIKGLTGFSGLLSKLEVTSSE